MATFNKKRVFFSFSRKDISLFQEHFARLADVAPTHFVVLSEETDWGLIGGDLRDAIESVERETAEPVSPDHEKELVEA